MNWRLPIRVAIFGGFSLLVALASPAGAAPAARPSFDGAKAGAGPIEALVCGDAALAALDRQLAQTYSAALAKDAKLKAEQRGWIKGRDVSLREHQGGARIAWGVDAPEVVCTVQ